MDSIFHTVFYFIITIGVLVAFHEYGHFWVARKMGVKVLRFSIGFGKVIWSYQKQSDSTQYVLSAIPLGGYVKMLDEREGPVEEQDLPYAFNRKPLLSRILVVLAGPVFNLFLAVLLFWCVFMLGETGIRPLLGPVAVDSIAAKAGLIEGDEIISVNEKNTPTWTEAMTLILSGAVAGGSEINMEIKNIDGITEFKQMFISEQDALDPDKLLPKLGLVPWSPVIEPKIGKILEDQAADQAGLKVGDLIISADDQAIKSWTQWVELIRASPEQTINLVVERDGVHLNLQLTPLLLEKENDKIGRIGASVEIPQDLIDSIRVVHILPPLAALEAAFKRTWLYSVATLKVMGSMLAGKASVDNLSGPISIAQFAGQSASMGLVYFLKFMASVSIGLGIVNLLPIPVLDGGHLMFYIIEGLKGSPVSEQTQIVFQNFGMMVLLMLMGLAIFLDIGRIVG